MVFIFLISFGAAADPTPLAKALFRALYETQQCAEALHVKDPRWIAEPEAQRKVRVWASKIEQANQSGAYTSHLNPPLLVDPSGKNPDLNLTNALMIQYGAMLLNANSQDMISFAERFADEWRIAWAKQVEASYKEREMVEHFNQFAQLVRSQAQTDEPLYLGVFPNPPAFKGQDVFPALKKVALDTPDYLAQFKKNTQKAILEHIEKHKANPAYFLSLSQMRELERQLQDQLVPLAVKPLKDSLKDVEKKIGNFEQEVVRRTVEKRPTGIKNEILDWHDYLSINAADILSEWRAKVPEALNELLNALQAQFPLREIPESVRRLTNEIAAVQSSTQQSPLGTFSRYFSPDGLSVELPKLRIKVDFDTDLGTSIMTSDDGLITNPKGPHMILWHGEGGTVSTAASFKQVFALIARSFGFNVTAHDLDFAGLGAPIRDVRESSYHLDHILRTLQFRFRKAANADDRPLSLVGRSLGGTRALIHSMLYGDSEDPIDLYALMSYSNILTMKEQTEKVYEQAASGMVSGVLRASMENGDRLAEEMEIALKRVERESPELLQSFGSRITFHQGDNDADGGPRVVEQLLETQERFAPLSHVYVYRMPPHQEAPLKEIKSGREAFYKGRRVKLEEFEAQHNLISNLPDTEFSQPRSQSIEFMAVQYAMKDFMADGIGPDHSWPTEKEREVQRKAIALRELLCAPGQTLLEWYAAANNVTIPAVTADTVIDPYTRVLAERFARVKKFWIDERIRIEKHYRSLGMIP